MLQHNPLLRKILSKSVHSFLTNFADTEKRVDKQMSKDVQNTRRTWEKRASCLRKLSRLVRTTCTVKMHVLLTYSPLSPFKTPG